MSIHANLGGQADNSIRLGLINCNCDVCVRKQNVVRNLWEIPNFLFRIYSLRGTQATINLQEYGCSQCGFVMPASLRHMLDHLPTDDANPDCPVVFSIGGKKMPRKLCRYQIIMYYRQRKLWYCGISYTLPVYDRLCLLFSDKRGRLWKRANTKVRR